MEFSPEQMRIIEDALEYSCNALSDDFEQNKRSREESEIQRSVEIYGRIRRINRLLNELRKNSGSEPQNGKVLVFSNRR